MSNRRHDMHEHDWRYYETSMAATEECIRCGEERVRKRCDCGCRPEMHVGEIGCPCALPGESPCSMHTRADAAGGPDVCAECSEAVGEWITWPCSREAVIAAARGQERRYAMFESEWKAGVGGYAPSGATGYTASANPEGGRHCRCDS